MIRKAAGILALALAYVALGKVSLLAATEHRAVSSIWPPTGLALFVLLRYGRGYWPGVALGAFAVNVSGGIPLAASLVIGLGDAAEAVLGAHLVGRALHGRRSLDRVRDVVALTALGGALAPMVGATIGVATLVAADATTMASAASLWLVWWTGDAVGVLVVAPLLLLWTTPEQAEPAVRWRWVEAGALFLALALATDYLFARAGALVFAIYPLALVISWRRGPRAATTAAAVVTLVASWRTLAGYGPFTDFTPTVNLFALQFFLALLAVMGLAFAAARAEGLHSAARLAEGRAQLQQLSRLLLTAQEDERRRVAREVHDELGQALTAVKMSLANPAGRSPRRPSLETSRREQNVADLLDRAIASVQRIVLRLRPGVLDSLGPLAALEHEAQEFRAHSGVAVTLELPPDVPGLDAEQSTVLYRTVQEALTNVARHARASHVTVQLAAGGDALVLQVADDGVGIADDQLRKPRSMGLLGMRERAAACGGHIDIRRRDGGGTCVTLTIPRRGGQPE
ncbi:MAG: MASE1 domain-containing protein [Gemmatimonadota bacterium]|nr:MASE1 domain-containing protein [Gemmatimonadota bacterium]